MASTALCEGCVAVNMNTSFSILGCRFLLFTQKSWRCRRTAMCLDGTFARKATPSRICNICGHLTAIFIRSVLNTFFVSFFALIQPAFVRKYRVKFVYRWRIAFRTDQLLMQMISRCQCMVNSQTIKAVTVRRNLGTKIEIQYDHGTILLLVHSSCPSHKKVPRSLNSDPI